MRAHSSPSAFARARSSVAVRKSLLAHSSSSEMAVLKQRTSISRSASAAQGWGSFDVLSMTDSFVFFA